MSEAHLPDRHAEHGGPHLPHHAPDTRVLEIEPEARQQLEPRQKRRLERELRDAAREHRPRQRPDRRIEIRAQATSAKTMNDRLSSTGVNAGTQNRL